LTLNVGDEDLSLKNVEKAQNGDIRRDNGHTVLFSLHDAA
jgi:hypothetical protein